LPASSDHLLDAADAAVVRGELVQRFADRLPARQGRQGRPDRLLEGRRPAVGRCQLIGGVRFDEEKLPVYLCCGRLARDRADCAAKGEIVEYSAVDEVRVGGRRSGELVLTEELARE
jgi:hypothetical protein